MRPRAGILAASSGMPRFYDYRNLITITTKGECNGNTRLVGSQGSLATETYPSTTRICIARLGYFKLPSYRYSDIPLVASHS